MQTRSKTALLEEEDKQKKLPAKIQGSIAKQSTDANNSKKQQNRSFNNSSQQPKKSTVQVQQTMTDFQDAFNQQDFEEETAPPEQMNVEYGQLQPTIEEKITMAKKLLVKLNGPTREAAIASLTKSLVPKNRRVVQIEELSPEQGQQILAQLGGNLTEIDQALQSMILNFFKKRGNRVVYRKIAKESQLRNSPLFKAGMRIAKMIRAKRALDNLNTRNLSTDFIQKRAALSAAAKKGSVSLLVNKYSKWQKNYGSSNPNAVIKGIKQRFIAGQAKTLTRIGEQVRQAAANGANLSERSITEYRTAQAALGGGGNSEDAQRIRASLSNLN